MSMRNCFVVKMCTELFLLTLLIIAGADPGDQYKFSREVAVNCSCGPEENPQDLALDFPVYKNRHPEPSVLKWHRILRKPEWECANRSCRLKSVFTTLYVHNEDDSGNQSNFSMKISTDLDDPRIPSGSFEVSYPQYSMFSIPSGGLPGGHRHVRQTEQCYVPSLKNAAIKCWKWPNWINCDVKCLPGYALKTTGSVITSININCRLTENVWKPQGFQDCEPYINCKAHLIKPGELNCIRPEEGPAYCEISCLDYDEFEATAQQKYECIDESFASTLPHCAVVPDDVALIQKPN